MEKISLNDKWQLCAKKIEQNQYIKENDSFEVSLPFEVHDVLSRSNVIPEPYFKDNIDSLSFIGRGEWEISKHFTLNEKKGRALLSLSSLDTIATLYINRKEIRSFDNEFLSHIIDVTDYIEEGENEISFSFKSPISAIKEIESSLPFSLPEHEYKGKIKGGNLIRKSSASFGSLTSPPLITLGIYKELSLVLIDNYYAEGTALTVSLIDDKWRLKAEFNIYAYKEEEIEISLSFQQRDVKKTIKLTPGTARYSITLDVEKDSVELWYPNGYGRQHIYNAYLTAGSFECNKKCAFRTIEVKRNITMGGRELAICVNGEDIFIKGAVWTGLDAIRTRCERRGYERALESAALANMNLIRVHGSSYYENDEFYSECDRLGLLVWHDMMFSSSAYRADDEFLKSVYEEIQQNVFRLKGHPSIALWATDNECFTELDMHKRTLINRDRYIISYNKLSSTIESAIKSEDDRTVLYSTPSITPDTLSPSDDENGDIHISSIWNEDKDISAYTEIRPRFVSEFGYFSLPSPLEAQSFDDEDKWNITSAEFEAHNRDEEGNARIVRNIARDFRFPSKIENIMYLSEALQALATERAVSYYRSLMPYCMGTIFMSLNEPWPSIAPSSIEYSGMWKLLQYSARRFYSPITPLLFIKDNRLYLYAINDTDKREEGEVQIKFRTYSGKKKEAKLYSIFLEPKKATKIEEFPLSKLDVKNVFAYARLSTKKTIKERTIILTSPKLAHLEDPELKVTVTKLSAKKLNILLTSTHPAFRVALGSGRVNGVFSDNLFAVRPTAERNIIFNGYDDVDIEEFKKELVVYDLYSATR